VTDDVKKLLRDIYDRAVEHRDGKPAPAWELEQRGVFLGHLEREHCLSLLELGAATGTDGRFFADHGLSVVCIDLSLQMIRRCRAKNLLAFVADVTQLGLASESFDAVYARNCLVHVPEAEIEGTLVEIARVLKPEGLFYLAVYGGREFEGIWDGDSWTAKRFFSFRTDEHLLEIVSQVFVLHSFDRIPHGFGGQHYQSLVLRKPRAA
jgi:SAM-dependent methyltransferase